MCRWHVGPGTGGASLSAIGLDSGWPRSLFRFGLICKGGARSHGRCHATVYSLARESSAGETLFPFAPWVTPQPQLGPQSTANFDCCCRPTPVIPIQQPEKHACPLKKRENIFFVIFLGCGWEEHEMINYSIEIFRSIFFLKYLSTIWYTLYKRFCKVDETILYWSVYKYKYTISSNLTF